MELTLNGRTVRYDGDPGRSLMRFLRDDWRITSVKDGCAPQAACGCCAVELDGKVVLACVISMGKAAGGVVRTLEGVDGRERDVMARAFAQCGGAQCAFCIPGIVMRAVNLLEANPDPSREQIVRALNQHLCRCTGYHKIIESILVAGRSLRTGEAVPTADTRSGVGARLAKYDIERAVLGQRPYVADLSFESMLHGAVRLSDHPRARVVSIDTSVAEAMPGVERVCLARDVPGQRRVGLIVPDWPLMIEAGETTCYIGDVIACVAARSRDEARAAAAAIEVAYEVLEPICDPAAARSDTQRVHPDRSNVLSTSIARKGDVGTAWARCAHVVEHTYQTQRIEHGFLEPEAAVAMPTAGGGVRVYSQSQGVYEDRRQIGLLLGLDEQRVEIELVPNGGGFGGKEDLCVQGHAALMAVLTGRTVKIELTRDESIRMHPKRHPIEIRLRLGCSAAGELVALRARMLGDSGAYASVGMKVLERAAGHATGAYHIEHVDVEAVAVYTNNVPCGAMRGFGANQANFAIECAIDELCELGGFDRWQLRYDNALTEGRSTATGQVLASGVGVRRTLEAVRERFESAAVAGIACGLKNTGIGNGMADAGTARIVIESADEVRIHHGWTEMGQGVHTMAVQTLCQETGLPAEIVRVSVQTSAETPCGMTTASRATSLVGNAIIDACRQLKQDLAGCELGELVGREYFGQWVCDWTNKPGASDGPPVTHYSYSYATQVVILDDAGTVERVVAAHDAGRVMNPTLFEGQIEGSVHMGLGYALSEDLPMAGGQLESTRLRKCGILRARDMPPVEVIGVEVPDEFGPYGAKGVGEIGLVPTAAAVANALYVHDGVRRRTLPMRD